MNDTVHVNEDAELCHKEAASRLLTEVQSTGRLDLFKKKKILLILFKILKSLHDLQSKQQTLSVHLETNLVRYSVPFQIWTESKI